MAALSEGFGALKSAILDVVNAGYEAELNAIDQSISKRQDKISELEGLIDEEYDKKENGYANDYDALVQQKANEEALLKEDNKKRIAIQKEQLKTETAIQAAQQVGALVTAVANMVASGSKLGIFGLPLIAASVIGLFALYKNYKNQVKAISSQAAYKGGKISDYLLPGKSGRSDRPGYGRGHHVEDTNLVIGADEYLMNGKTTAAQMPFLNELNSGKYDNTNLMALLRTKSDKEHVQDFVVINEKKEQIKQQSNDEGMRKAMSEMFEKQTKALINDNARRPTIINHSDGTVEVITYNSNGVTRKLIRSGN